MRYLLIILAFLAGCGHYVVKDHGIYQKPQNYKPSGIVDAEMQAFLDEYNAEAAKRHVKATYSRIVEVNWADELKDGDQTLWGYCQTYINPDNSLVSSIRLSRHMNTDISACQRKLIIFHEFSHGLLGVKHTDRDPANVLQIMYWSSGWEQAKNCDPDTGEYKGWSDYLDFLFGHQELEQVE